MHDNAPVVCVEGATHSHATHKLIHNEIDGLMSEHRKSKGDNITTDDAIKAGIKSHQETFRPKCDEKCLAAQLHQYYDKMCKDQLKPRGGKGLDAPVVLPPAGPVGLPTTTRR